MNQSDPEPQCPPRRPLPVANSLALAAPFVGFVCGIAAGAYAPHFQWFLWGFRVWVAFGVAGLLCGSIAIARGERWWGLALAGLVLNGVLVIVLGALFVMNQ